MEGPSRSAWNHALATLQQTLATAEPRALARELFAISESVDSTTHLRRALSDPSRDGVAKRELARRLYGGKVSPQALTVLESAVSHRWVTDRDLVDSLERLGIDAVLAAAEREGNLDRVENELFGFERLVSGDGGLHNALAAREVDGAAKATLIASLLESRALPDTVWLAQRPVLHPRGRRFSAAIWRQLKLAARRRERLTAIVTSAVDLDPTQRERLASALARIYGHPVFIDVAVDPAVLGGMHIRVGDEVLDGTMMRRLDEARRAIVG